MKIKVLSAGILMTIGVLWSGATLAYDTSNCGDTPTAEGCDIAKCAPVQQTSNKIASRTDKGSKEGHDFDY